MVVTPLCTGKDYMMAKMGDEEQTNQRVRTCFEVTPEMIGRVMLGPICTNEEKNRGNIVSRVTINHVPTYVE